MTMKMKIMIAVLLLVVLSLAAVADDRENFNRRAAEADLALLRQLDLNGDGYLTKDEAKGDLRLGPRFDDIDINRDGVITPQEMRRYIEQTYGVNPAD
jgi:Ca2+-binding EF-hand superfamily protein